MIFDDDCGGQATTAMVVKVLAEEKMMALVVVAVVANVRLSEKITFYEVVCLFLLLYGSRITCLTS